MAEANEGSLGGEGHPALPPLGGREPPGVARPGPGSGGQTGVRRATPPPVGDGQRRADSDQARAGFHTIQGSILNTGIKNDSLIIHREKDSL